MHLNLVHQNFVASVMEPFARHIRALEKHLIDERQLGLDRVRVLPEDSEDNGKPRLALGHSRILVIPQGYCVEIGDYRVQACSAYIVVGVPGVGKPLPEIGWTLRQAEQTLQLKVRYALAHEIAHIALGHCYVGEDGFEVPAGGFSPEQEIHARRYGIRLCRLVGAFLMKRISSLQVAPGHNVDEYVQAARELWPDEADALEDWMRSDVMSELQSKH